MHAIAPVVSGIRRNVDAFAFNICKAQFFIHRKPILECQYGKHRRTIEMTAHHFFAHPTRSISRNFTTEVEHIVVVATSLTIIFTPPTTECSHVVRANGANRAFGIPFHVTKFVFRIFRHTLNFEREQLEFVHHPGHTVGHHSQVFTTRKHRSRFAKFWKFLHCAIIPELIVTFVEVVIVKTIESILLMLLQSFENQTLLSSNARMIHTMLFVIFHKKHIVDEREHTILQSLSIRQRLTFLVEISLHRTLCGIFWTERPNIIVTMFQEGLFHPFALFSKHAIKNILADERRSHKVFLEIKTETSYFLWRHRKRWRELTEQSLHTVTWNFPNAEESENVVNAISREILRHFCESAFPPAITVLLHHFPVVSGEAPVLSVSRESIGWRTGLTIHVEIIGFNPSFNRVARDADGNIALKHHLFAACVVASSKKLHVQEILYIIVVSHRLPDLAFGCAKFLYLG